jgi:hypothetical protein
LSEQAQTIAFCNACRHNDYSCQRAISNYENGKTTTPKKNPYYTKAGDIFADVGGDNYDTSVQYCDPTLAVGSEQYKCFEMTVGGSSWKGCITSSMIASRMSAFQSYGFDETSDSTDLVKVCEDANLCTPVAIANNLFV